jgi:hypothetical protein
MPQHVILLHAAAAPKPATGTPCNGCGQCCAAEPCPLGMLVSRRRVGACAALSWSEADGRYHCGVVAAPARWLPWLPAPLVRRLALRWIASGAGCDAEIETA